jgi:hypothetical protein
VPKCRASNSSKALSAKEHDCILRFSSPYIDILLVTANAEPFMRDKAGGASTHVTCVGNNRALK